MQDSDADDDDDADECRERRLAELEFVASAYNSETEAWHDTDATTGDPVVHRLISLTISDDAEEMTASAKLQISLTMPPSYPMGNEPLFVQARLLHKESSSSIRKCALNVVPLVVKVAQDAANESIGSEAVFSVLSRTDEWLAQGEWSEFYKKSSLNHDDATLVGVQLPTNVVFGRHLIYSHHIISKVKRQDIQSLARDLQLTGYMKIGWPGLLIIEGREDDCIAFYDTIRRWNWQYLVVRGEQQDRLTSSTTECIQKHRKFDKFQEVEDMSIVAQHCREVGLENLFRTSMKLYDSDNTLDEALVDDSSTSPTTTLFGNLVHVDHMNDPKGYRKWLRKTAKETNTRLLIKQCYPQDNYSKRPKILVAVVGSSAEQVSAFMKRWRTSRVDVDSREKPCLERQMTVLVEGPLQQTTVALNEEESFDWDAAVAEDSVTTLERRLGELLTEIGGTLWKEAFENLLLVPS